ncbi:MAG: DUF222 domain-containing protein [Mycobacteriales bacterium]
MFESAISAHQRLGGTVRHLRLVASAPAVRLAELMTMDPSAEVLAEIDDFEASELDEGERVTVLALWERCAAWLAARQQRAIVDVTGPAPVSPSADDWGRLDVAAAVRLSPLSAARRVEVARQLVGRLRATGKALETGTITFWYAVSLVEGVAQLDDAAAAEVERVALDGAGTLTLAAFRARIRRAVIAAAPKDADERHEQAVKARRVVFSPQPDGMAWLSAYLTAPEAIAGYRAIYAAAYRASTTDDADDDHTNLAGPRRADAFMALLTGSGGDGGPQPGLPALSSVLLTMDLPTALRLADHPGHLDGYGEIPPELARQLAADGSWQRLVTDPVTGHLLDFGRTTYRPPAALARYIRARDVTCRFPGCSRRAQLCDLDHADAWDCEGTTCSPNLGALCRHHHRAKTHAGWTLESRPDGSARWTSPRGPTYERPAINHNPEHTARVAAECSDPPLAAPPDKPPEDPPQPLPEPQPDD